MKDYHIYFLGVYEKVMKPQNFYLQIAVLFYKNRDNKDLG